MNALFDTDAARAALREFMQRDTRKRRLYVFHDGRWLGILGAFDSINHARAWAARARRQLGCAVWIKPEEL